MSLTVILILTMWWIIHILASLIIMKFLKLFTSVCVLLYALMYNNGSFFKMQPYILERFNYVRQNCLRGIKRGHYKIIPRMKSGSP
jgi:hypothetical protein